MEDVTPPGARFVRLDGFASLVDVEDMLRSLAAESRADGAEARIGEFSRRWREMAEQLAQQHRGKRLLVLSTCMGAPFSFGRRHVIGDLFVQAGFQVVESAPKIRHVLPGEEIPDLNTLIAATQPEIVVALSSESADFCHMAVPNVGIRIVPLDGRHFIHPGPGLLEAYEEIRAVFGQTEAGASSP
jgi:iron complex transport system substrate-binding protein